MSSGGKRDGAGRPKGSRGLVPRDRKKKVPVPTVDGVQAFKHFKERFYGPIKPYLDSKTRKMYEELMGEESTPLEIMKTIMKDLMVRYKIGRIQELNALKTWEGITKFVDSIRQLAESIAKIEQQSPTLNINILNILTQDSHQEKATELYGKIFNLEESTEVEFEEVDPIGNSGIVESEEMGITGLTAPIDQIELPKKEEKEEDLDAI